MGAAGPQRQALSPAALLGGKLSAGPSPGTLWLPPAHSHVGAPGARLLHLVQVVGAPVVDVMAQAGGHHGEGLQVRVVALQFARLQRQEPTILQPVSTLACPCFPALLGGGRGVGGRELGPTPLPLPSSRALHPLPGLGVCASQRGLRP